VAATVRRAAAGDQDAWVRLIDMYNPLLWSIAARYRIPRDQAGDLVQTTWLRLIDTIGDLRHPGLVGGWLNTTMRRLCLRALSRELRERPTSSTDDWTRLADSDEPPDSRVIRAERAITLRTALRQLPERQQRLMWYIATTPAASYKDISMTLGIPVGAIGPTRARALGRLRDLLREDRLTGALAD
jgi:RNA polymerase sigma factor (sigma-70 family)